MAKYFLDMDMPMDDLAEVFDRNGWVYAVRGVYGKPSPDDLVAQVMYLATGMDDADLNYLHQGRLALVRDPEMDGVFQVLLTVGYLYNSRVEAFENA